MRELLLLNYENERNFGLLRENGDGSRLKVLPLLTRRARKGDWIHGWFRGRWNFFAIYFTADTMRAAVRDRVCELHPIGRRETVTWHGDGPRAELVIARDGEELLRYRYLRRLRYVIEDEDFPEHDLPQWLHRMWSNPEAGFERSISAGGLYRA